MKVLSSSHKILKEELSMSGSKKLDLPPNCSFSNTSKISGHGSNHTGFIVNGSCT
jgi:hypothetical protein